jgi:hypothetical protein
MKLNISGKSVQFKSNALFPVKYKSEFKRDIFKDLKYLEGLKNISATNIDEFNMDAMYDIVWTLAWFGDRSIPERDEWLLSFEQFDVYEILPQVLDVLADSLATTKKKQNPQKAKLNKRQHLMN